MYKQIDKQIDRQIDRQTDRQADRQADRQIDRQTDRQTDIYNAYNANLQSSILQAVIVKRGISKLVLLHSSFALETSNLGLYMPPAREKFYWFLLFKKAASFPPFAIMEIDATIQKKFINA